MDDCPPEYLAFNDCTDEVVEGFKTDTITGWRKIDGDDFIPRYGSNGQHGCPEGYEEAEEACTIYYGDDIQRYAKDYHGYSIEDGKFGYYENPNAKWDWYQLGGRWCGFFKVKPEYDGASKVGSRGLMGSCRNEGTMYVDQAKKYQIDFESMVQESRDKAAADYDFIASLFDDGVIPKIEKPWSHFLALKDSGVIEEIKEAREQYWAQPSLIRWKDATEAARTMEGITDRQKSLAVWAEATDYQMSRDEYIDFHGKRAFQTFAVVTEDGKWHEKGSMGWFGCVSDEKGPEDWTGQFYDLFQSLPDDTLLSVFDCHI